MIAPAGLAIVAAVHWYNPTNVLLGQTAVVETRDAIGRRLRAPFYR